MKTSHKVVVVGAGTMGNGIAHVFAQYGYHVTMVDIAPEALEKGMTTIRQNLDRMVQKEKISAGDKEQTIGRLQTSSSIQDALKDATLVIEAATENVDLKLKLFRDFNVHASKEAILATNTSSSPTTRS